MTHDAVPVPSLVWVAPFAALLLCIALLPLIPPTSRWWEHNRNKLIVAIALAIVTAIHYYTRGFGMVHGEHASEPGWPTVVAMLRHAVLGDYIPFIVLLFSLYTISGGISLRGDIPAHPATNTVLLAAGAMLASFVGTTGAAMLLIRPLLQINSERRHVRHTVIFFIFLVCNIGGCLLPIGDPPLFLGYLRGVPFLWTFQLWKEWLFCVAVLLVIYYAWDTYAYRHEAQADLRLDEGIREPLRLRGGYNFVWVLGVILAVALLVPGRKPAGLPWVVPDFLREAVLLGLTLVAWLTTPKQVRADNRFNFIAITEVAFLFIGIFICMQIPIEILRARGPALGLHKPWHFFWATGVLSSFLDNAPTYAVYFATAGSLHESGMPVLNGVATASGVIPIPLLIAVSLGSVFMGANTYIGNGPNFMVKSIAEQAGVEMPSFFGYMGYSIAILIPLFVLVTVLFMPG
ncbi:MAG TPA: sodium:proton antiporter [Phycisphaerae bacterium]|nr:sodium:proton antiporter [Phycisphaerae bacterium]